jgi:hypothetical protein
MKHSTAHKPISPCSVVMQSSCLQRWQHQRIVGIAWCGRMVPGPSMDHYQYDLYYIPKTWAYQISGSTELFPQHCQMPNMTPHQHFCALTKELAKSTAIASATKKGRRLIKLLKSKIKDILNPPALANAPQAEQRAGQEEQRVIGETPILTIPWITDAPPIIQAWNPTAK